MSTIEQKLPEQDRFSANFPAGSGQSPPAGDSAAKVLWRHKGILLIFSVLGLGLGYWLYNQKPTTYGASTQLMIKSESPLTLESSSRIVVGGLPNGAILKSLIYSDQVMKIAAVDPELTTLSGMKSLNTSSISNLLRAGIEFSPSTDSRDSTDRMIAVLSFKGSEPDTCVAAVNATSRAIQDYFNRERDNSVGRVSELIDRAEKKLLPQLTELEGKYQDFRRSSPLEWDASGNAINPHRVREAALLSQHVSIQQEMRRLSSNLKIVKTVWERNKDADLVFYLLAQSDESVASQETFGNRLTSTPELGEVRISVPELHDLELEELGVEQTLVPLLVEQQQMVVQFGTSHPAVRTLDAQVAATRQSLNDLSARIQRRIEEIESTRRQERLAKNGEQGDLSKETEQAVNNRMFVLGGRIEALNEQLSETDALIQQEKVAANALSQLEKDDEMYRRQISRVQGLIVQLEEQMSRIDLGTVNNGIVVQSLYASVIAGITGPYLIQDLIMFGLGGLTLGAMLAFFLNSNLRMFRSSDEISDRLQAPVLTHVPLDEGVLSDKGSGKKKDPSGLDSGLVVVHRPGSPCAEAVRCIRTAIFFDASKNGNKVYQLTSPLPGDGKSTMAANLACSIAAAGKKVLLIDLDLRSPRLTARFHLSNAEGITNLLNGDCDPRTAIRSTVIENLDILPSGSIPSNPAEALWLPEMAEAFEWFKDQYEFVIVDTPPLLLVTDPAIITNYVDKTLLVIQIVRCCQPNSMEAIKILKNAGAKVLGVVVNKLDSISMGNYYQIGGTGSYGSVGYGYGKTYRNDRLKSGEAVDYVVRGGSVFGSESDAAAEEQELEPALNGKAVGPH